MDTHQPTGLRPLKPDPLIAALSVVCPLICGRALSSQEIVYIRTRISRHEPAVLLEALEWLGDHAERIGNPIAAILDRCGVIRRDRADREVAEAMAAGDPESGENRKRLQDATKAHMARLASKIGSES